MGVGRGRASERRAEAPMLHSGSRWASSTGHVHSGRCQNMREEQTNLNRCDRADSLAPNDKGVKPAALKVVACALERHGVCAAVLACDGDGDVCICARPPLRARLHRHFVRHVSPNSTWCDARAQNNLRTRHGHVGVRDPLVTGKLCCEPCALAQPGHRCSGT